MIPPPSPLAGVARDSLYNLTRDGWRIVLAIGVSALLARGLGTAGRGDFQTALVLAMLLGTFLNLGVGPATVYHVSRRPSDLTRIVRGNVALGFWLGVLGMVLGLLVAVRAGDVLFHGVSPYLLALALWLVPVNLQAAYLVSVYQGLQDFRRLNLAQMAGQAVLLASVVVLVWGLHLGVAGAIAAQLVTAAATLAILVGGLASRVDFRRVLGLRLDLDHAREVLAYGLKAYVANVVGFLNYRVDVLLLRPLAGATAVGIYSVAVGVAEHLWMVPNAVAPVVFPRIAALEGAEAARRRLTPIVARHALWFGVAVAAVVYVTAEWIVLFLGGEGFRDATRPLRLLLPGIVSMGVARIIANDLSGRGRPGVNSIVSLVALGANVALNLVWIPRFGASGASLASTVSYSVLAVLLLVVYRRTTGVPWRDLLFLQREDVLRLRAVGAAALRRRVRRTAR